MWTRSSALRQANDLRDLGLTSGAAKQVRIYNLAWYRVNSETGALTPLETYAVGKRSMWVLMTRLGG